jgi:hypothetical protein
MTPEQQTNFTAAVVFGLIVSLIVAAQARRRGYSLVEWALAGMLSSNPLFLLILLGVLPDFARRKMREKELQDLESRLKAKPRRLAPDGSDTLPLHQQAAKPKADRSVGDQPTVLPERSLGDDETRL